MKYLPVLQRIFREVFDDDGLNVDLNTAQHDIPEWDSVAHVKIVIALESECDLRFSSDEVSQLTSVKALLSAINRKQSN